MCNIKAAISIMDVCWCLFVCRYDILFHSSTICSLCCEKVFGSFVSSVFSCFMLIRNFWKKNTDSKQRLRDVFDQAVDWRLFWTHNTHGKKINCPLNLISGFATLDGNDCSQVFALTVNEPFTSLWNFFPAPLKNGIISAIVGGLIGYGHDTASELNIISQNFG